MDEIILERIIKNGSEEGNISYSFGNAENPSITNKKFESTTTVNDNLLSEDEEEESTTTTTQTSFDPLAVRQQHNDQGKQPFLHQFILHSSRKCHLNPSLYQSVQSI